MKITKLRFKNAFGITEKELDPKDITLIEGVNESGKTSILDSIKATLTNKNIRTRLVKNGTEEAELYIETDTGLIVDRKKRTTLSDYVSVKEKERIVAKPETYLRSIFSDEQFNPIKDFIEKKPKEQKKTILSICDIPFTEQDVENVFGEIPEDYNSTDHVLENLERIQSKSGYYYKSREDLNREIKSKKNTKNEIQETMPKDYDPKKWEKLLLSDIYSEIEKANKHNAVIKKKEYFIENSKKEIEFVEGKEIKEIKEIENSYDDKTVSAEEEIYKMEQKIKELQDKIKKEKEFIAYTEAEKEKAIKEREAKSKEEIEMIEEEVESDKKYLENNKEIDIEPLKEKAKKAEEMKGYLRDAEKVSNYEKELEEMQKESDRYTEKIELARTLPTQLLAKAKMPIPGISIEEGELLIDNLPIDNLSEGRQMEIALEVAKAKAGELKVVLIDGFEKLCTKRREEFFAKAKETGLQFFITRVTDSEELNIIEI